MTARLAAWWPCFVLLSAILACGSPFALGRPWALLTLGVLVGAVLGARRLGFRATQSVERFLASQTAVLVTAAVTSLVVWIVWGSLRAPPVIHDESAYLFQADLFASGRWSAPTPELPEFFEQFHVLIVPMWTSKYPPGHSLLLTLGVVLGLPALVPIVLSGVTGGLVFALARRIADVWVGLLTWGFWTTAGGNLHYRPAYFSEVTTSALVVCAWWALIEWKNSGKPWWLVCVGAAVGWGAITRPLTMLAVALPVAFLVLLLACRRRAWRQVAMAGVFGAVIVAVIPLWSARTTGNWRQTPMVLYAETYLPFDLPGFGAVSERPLRSGPPELAKFDAFYRSIRNAHTISSLPGTFVDRWVGIAFDMWGGWRAALLPFVVVGLFFLSTEGWFGVLTAVLLVIAYLTYYHHQFHTRYYLELQPVLAYVSVVGLMATVRKLVDEKSLANRQGRPVRRGAPTFALLVCLLAFWPAWFDLTRARVAERSHTAAMRQFRESLHTIRDRKALVFLKYGRNPDIYRSLMSNEPDLAHARTWIVYDRGAENADMERLAPDRQLYVYDLETRVLRRGIPETRSR